MSWSARFEPIRALRRALFERWLIDKIGAATEHLSAPYARHWMYSYSAKVPSTSSCSAAAWVSIVASGTSQWTLLWVPQLSLVYSTTRMLQLRLQFNAASTVYTRTRWRFIYIALASEFNWGKYRGFEWVYREQKRQYSLVNGQKRGPIGCLGVMESATQIWGKTSFQLLIEHLVNV